MITLAYIFLALSLVTGALIKISPIPTVNVYFFDVLSFLIVFLTFRQITLFMKENFKLLLPVYVFIVVSSLGVILHSNSLFEFTSSISYLGRLILYMLLTVPLLNLTKENLKKIKKWMLYSGFIFVGLGYIQYLYYPNLRNLYYLGWDEHLFRLFSTFLDPNFAGVFIVLIIFLYTSFFLEFPRNINNLRRALFFLGYVFLVPALFLTYSRSSLLVFILSSVILLVLLKKTRYILVLLVFVIFGLIVIPKNLAGEGVNLMRTASAVARFQYSERAVQIFLDHPILGVGYDTLRFTSAKYGFVKGTDILTSHAAAGVPNSYLVILATTGVVGFLAIGYFLLNTLKGIYRLLKEDKGKNLFAVIVFTSILGVLLGSLFENLLFYAPIMLWLVLLTGIFFGISKKT